MTSHDDVSKQVSADEVEIGEKHDASSGGDRSYYQAVIDGISPEERKKFQPRVDIRVVLALGILYAVSLMDRNNSGNAMIAGMNGDLEMSKGVRYSLIVLLFFIPYTLFQPAATALLRVIGPRTFLSVTCLVWGMATIAAGFVKDWYDLIPIRLILGVCEAGFFPSKLPRIPPQNNKIPKDLD